MPKYAIRFVEVQRGWYEFEADNLEQAQAIVKDADMDVFSEPFYKDGTLEFDGDVLEL